MPTSGRNLQNIRYINREIIIEINKEMIDRFGGVDFEGADNVRNPDSLSYILEAIQNPICGKDLYPMIFEKAAALGHQIICRHVFYDGNKRTAFESIRLFLFINNYYLRIDKGIVEKALEIAAGKVSIGNLAKWLEQKAIPMEWPEESSLTSL